MKALRYALLALLFVSVVHARPRVVEEIASITPPQGSNWEYFGRRGVAIDLTHALVMAERSVHDAASGITRWEAAALLYQRLGQNLYYQGQLGPTEEIDEWTRPGLAMRDGVAIVILKKARVFQQEGLTTVWNEEPVARPWDYQGADIEVHAQHILVSRISGLNETVVLRKSNGTWVETAQFIGSTNSGGDSPPVPFISIDVTAGRAAVFNEEGLNFEPPMARVYRRIGTGTSWGLLTQIDSNNDTRFGPEIAIAGNHIAITGSKQRGTSIFYADPASGGNSYALSPYGLQTADGYMQRTLDSGTALEPYGSSINQRNWSHDRQAYVVNIFYWNKDPNGPVDENGNLLPDPAHSFDHKFTLQAKNGASLGEVLDVGHGRALVSGGRDFFSRDNVVRMYDVNGFSPPPVQVQDFEVANPVSPLAPTAGSTFTRVNLGNTWVYRQASTAGNPAAILFPTEVWRNNQAIQSEVTLRAISGSNAWVGLFTRYKDESNYYYVTLRASGSVEVKRMVNGVFTSLAAAPASVVVGRKYRLRLESIGNVHRVYLNDRRVLTARDASLTDGNPGIMMNRAAADYDNLIASPNPFTTIYTENFDDLDARDWNTATGTWLATGGVFQQTNPSGYGRALTGALTDDQVVRARIVPRSFVTPRDWVGLIARYMDDRNYLYVTMEGRGVISLWRRSNGGIQQLATRLLAVTPGVSYVVRVEVVAQTTRVFVNDRLVLASNADPGPDNPGVNWSRGKVGLITRNATAQFDDFLAYQP